VPVLGTSFVIAAGPNAFVNRYALSNPPAVFIGLISYPLYLWHWPILIDSRFLLVQLGHVPGVALKLSAAVLLFALSWATYNFVERPIRWQKGMVSRRRITAGCVLCMALLAVLGITTAASTGFPTRYPIEVRDLLLPHAFLEDFKPLPAATVRPLVVTWGDSHADHLLLGLERVHAKRNFTINPVRWWDECPPAGTVTDAQRCPAPGPKAMEKIRSLNPDIVLVAGAWFQYKNLDQKVGATLAFLKSIKVRRIILVGPVPVWPEPTRMLLYKLYRDDPDHRIPDRLPLALVSTNGPEIEQKMRDLANQYDVTYISPRSFLCNDQGCLARLGITNSLVQVDNSHFTADGSEYVISHFADVIFNLSRTD
jgi:hypothetical protein